MIGRWLSTTFAALAEPNFRILWVGSLFATLALMMMFVTQSVVAFELGGTNRAVGIVSLGVGISMLALGPFGGVTADRVSKRKVIVLGQGASAALFAVIGVLIVFDALTLLQLVLITTVLGLGFAFLSPARHSYVAELVPRRLLPNAVALNQLGMGTGQILAPFVAGVLLSTPAIGAGGTYLAMAALTCIGVVSLGLLRPAPRVPAAAHASVWADLRGGLEHVLSRPTLRLVVFLMIAMIVLGWMFRVVLPALLERHLDHAPTDIGLLLSINAIAAFVVSLALAGVVGTRWAWPSLFALAATLSAGYFVLAVAPSFEVALLAMVLIGPGFSSFLLVAQTVIMANAEPAFYGRVMSLTMIAVALQSIAAFPFGILADQIGERELLGVVGISTAAILVLGLLSYLRTVRGEAVTGRGTRTVAVREIARMRRQKSSRPLTPS